MADTGGDKPPRAGWVLRPIELDRIKHYVYKPGMYTVFDNVLTPYWNWAVQQLPVWASPNLVTFTGLVTVLVWTLVVMWYSQDLAQQLPSWLPIGYSAALFFYQTMDAIDGKQARRTKSSSPLGQLFDHGCDALVVLLCLIAVAATMGLGASWKTMLLFCNVELAFYLAQWEEYHTGTLNWSNGWFGVTESQLTQMLLFCMTGIFGLKIWHQPLTAVIPWSALEGEEYTVINFLLLVFTLVTTSMFVTSALHVASARADKLPIEERGDKTIGLLTGLIQLIPFCSVLVMAFLLASGPGAATFARHPGLQLFGMGITTTHICSRMIVHHMAKTQLLLHDMATPGITALGLTTINLYWTQLGLGKTRPVQSDSMLVGAVLFSAACYAWFIIGAVRDMCFYLGIRCFHLSPYKYRKKTL